MEDFAYFIRPCSRSLQGSSGHHCFFGLYRAQTMKDSLGFFGDGDKPTSSSTSYSGGVVLNEHPETLRRSRLRFDPALPCKNQEDCMEKWDFLTKCYHNERGRYHLVRNNCCTVASRCFDALLQKFSDLGNPETHMKDVNPSVTAWEKREYKEV